MNKDKVIEHYDFLSPYYHSLWGMHIHHGYWQTGEETKEEAQENLTKLLIDRGEFQKDQRILDVGCGIGGSSIYLAKNLRAKVTGITISSIQVEMAHKNALQENVNVDFKLMDAENMTLKKEFDIIWSIEALSHLNNQEKFFQNATQLLLPRGKFAIIDWFKKENLSTDIQDKFIKPIEEGMLTPNMKTMSDYKAYIEEAGLKVTAFEDISVNVSKTWDVSLEIIKNPALWKLAIFHGKDFVGFLKAFQAMRDGFSSKAFVYGLIVAEKNN